MLKYKHDIMEPEKIQGIVQNFKNAGVSEADIKYYFDSEGGAQDAWMGFYGGSSTGEKKKIYTLFAIHFGGGLYGVAFRDWFFGLHAR